MSEIPYKNWSVMSDDSIVRQIGEYVRYHRMQQNKTQTILAKEAGISRSTLSLLERGESVIVATLIQILRVLDQLQALEGFTIVYQQSPLLLAEAERKKRKRAGSVKKRKADFNKEVDW